MAERRDVVLEGVVSPTLLDGIEQLVEMWSRWCPRHYGRIEVKAARELEAQPSSERGDGLFAFSGGVDATFSFQRHLVGAAGRQRHRPSAAMMVLGLDIPADDQRSFSGAIERASRQLDVSEISLIRVATNSRQLATSWEDCFGMHLASNFLLFQKQFSHAFVASGKPYEDLQIPWGSLPLTDPLLSTGIMNVHHDGAGHDRTEKVKWLTDNCGDTVISNLRVCWQGVELDRNCGYCEKCIRTMLNFWAVKACHRGCFPHDITPQLCGRLNPKSRSQLVELIAIRRHAASRYAPNDAILRSLDGVIRRARILRFTSATRAGVARLISGN
ncbi:hypothetical protein [Pseudohaliea sp.]|uniref:hypothetical protein n=1 Tax=Pseudohaliea sp. TaxID=2740289 RepID=UPI0032ECC2A0